jgi:multidrug efflux system outer membrane protein
MSLCSVVLVSALALTGCAPQGDGYVKPTFSFLSKYKQGPAGQSVLLENTAWWRKLDDPVLNQMIGLALHESISLKIARERVITARAERQAVPGQLVLSSQASVRGEGVGKDGPVLSGPVELGLSWMLDPWGARRDQLRAADARTQVAEAEVGAARLLLLYNIALAHVDLRYRQRLLTLAERDLSRAAQTLRQTEFMREAGQTTRIDVTRAQARAAAVRAQLPTLKASIAGRINELSVLIGRAPGQLPPDLERALRHSTDQPHPNMSSQIGIPADLLRNRPDIRVAERRYYAAVTDIGVARSSLYPTLSLSGLITLNTLGPASNRPEYYFGPSVVFPAIPTKATRARVEVRESLARQEHETWRSTVLNAIVEVENALLEYNAVGLSLSSASRAARLYRESEQLTRSVVQKGEATITELIDVQREVAQADRTVADLVQQRALGFIEINVRLGAGHNASAPSRTAKDRYKRPEVTRRQLTEGGLATPAVKTDR